MRIIFSTILLLVTLLSYADNNTDYMWVRDSTYHVNQYELWLAPNTKDKSIEGRVDFHYRLHTDTSRIVFDLDTALVIDKILQNGVNLNYSRDGTKINVQLLFPESGLLSVYYNGHPRESEGLPWEAGCTFTFDLAGNSWFSEACESYGASVWWPCKDVEYEEPRDGILMHVIVPEAQFAASNGQYLGKKKLKKKKVQYSFRVSDPINLYNIHVSVGNYTFTDQSYHGANGTLAVKYALINERMVMKKRHLDSIVFRTISALEDWFGPYPFYTDGYQIIETPFLGMEHQSGIAYGNGFRNGYKGTDLSNTGVGLEWDFIVVHESGHEWFGNSITASNHADLWIHEGFTCYSETLFTETYYGKKKAFAYCRGEWGRILNDKPMIGNYELNQSGSQDIYYKGAAIIHMIRMMMDDDDKFKQMLREMNKKFYHSIVNSSQIENFIIEFTGLPLQGFFDLYLRSTNIPKLVLYKSANTIEYMWKNVPENFYMKLQISVNGKKEWLVTNGVKGVATYMDEIKSIDVDKNYLLDY